MEEEEEEEKKMQLSNFGKILFFEFLLPKLARKICGKKDFSNKEVQATFLELKKLCSGNEAISDELSNKLSKHFNNSFEFWKKVSHS